MKRRIIMAIFAGAAMLMLILDPETALQGAQDGIQLCIQVVIPSLFPLFVLTMLLTSSINLGPMAGIARLCGIPCGCESILIPALLGGYPVGAQAVAQAFNDGKVSQNSALRMLAFCSNAGPAFIFGMVARQFDKISAGWALWVIHIVSALLVGILLPRKEASDAQPQSVKPIGIQTALQRTIRVMASVCGWIVLFRVGIVFLEQWVLWRLPNAVTVVVIGLLELSNGCCQLQLIKNPGLRMITASGILSIGGLCVVMQTAAVTGSLGVGSYVRGKLWQTIFSLVLAFFAQRILFSTGQRFSIPAPLQAVGPVLLVAAAIILRQKEKNSSIPAGSGV